MSYLTSFQILLAFLTLYQGICQRTSPGRHAGQSYECYVDVEVYAYVRCEMEILHHGCEDFVYHFLEIISNWNTRLLKRSSSSLTTEMFRNTPNVFVCRKGEGPAADQTDGEFPQSAIPSKRYESCERPHSCLAYLHNSPVPVNVKSLNITKVETITLRKQSFQSYLNLEVLSVTESEVHLNHDVFYGLSSLRTLTLSGDHITVLPLEIFSGLELLLELNISRNCLREISKEQFASLSSLVSLDLSDNEIRTLSHDVFSTLPALKVLSLKSNGMKTLPATVFHETSNLTNIDLSGNGIMELAGEIFWNLRHLEVLDLSRCGLNSLHEDTFDNSTNLKVLILSYNELSFLPDDIFPVQFKLEVLDVRHNKLGYWGANTLRNVSALKTLLLNSNELESLPPNMLSATRHLKILDLTENKLQLFSGELIEPLIDLYVLNASRNNVGYVELGLKNPVFARILNFSRNEIKGLDIRWESFSYLENIDFEWNSLTSLSLPACVRYSRQTVFNFRENDISQIVLSYLTHDLQDVSNCSGLHAKTLFLAGNAIDCDCKLYQFYNQVTKVESTIPYKLPDKDKWVCQKPDFLKGSSFASVNKDVFLCPTKDCPQPCFCGVRATDSRTVVNCTGKNLEAVPESAPENVSILYFVKNGLNTLNLRKGIWQNLTELYLENNLLENVEATDLPEGLRVLSLSGNRLQNVSMSLRNFVSSRDNIRLRLGYNSLNCTCSLKSLKVWLLKEKRKVDDLDDVTCEIMDNEESRNVVLHKIADKLLCPEELSLSFHILTLTGTVSISVLVISGLFLLVVYYKNTETVLAFLYGTSLFHCFFREDPEEEEEKIFDAFVAYSSTDREVAMKLVEQLEGESPYFRLCIHERDWIAGQFVSENIVRSVQSSRRVVLILSEEFVSSAWFTVELRAVLLQMLQDRINRLVVIVVGAFPSLDAIDSDIRQLLLRRTYLVWDERWFWEKIRYALPHKGQCKKSSSNKAVDNKCKLVSLIEKDVSGALKQEVRSEDNVKRLSCFSV